MAITSKELNDWLDANGLSYDDALAATMGQNQHLDQRVRSMEGLMSELGNWHRQSALDQVFGMSLLENVDRGMIEQLNEELSHELSLDIRRKFPKASKSEVKEAVNQTIAQGRHQIAQSLYQGGTSNPGHQIVNWVNNLKESRGAPPEEYIDERLFRGGSGKLPTRPEGADEFDDAAAELMSDISGKSRDRYSQDSRDPWDDGRSY